MFPEFLLGFRDFSEQFTGGCWDNSGLGDFLLPVIGSGPLPEGQAWHISFGPAMATLLSVIVIPLRYAMFDEPFSERPR